MAAAAWWQAQSFGPGSGLLPRLASGTAGALALAGLLQRSPGSIEPIPLARPGAVLLAFVLYGLAMPRLGFLFSTTLLALGFTLGFGGRKAWRWALAGVAFVVLVYIAFGTIFYVNFPAGIAR